MRPSLPVGLVGLLAVLAACGGRDEEPAHVDVGPPSIAAGESPGGETVPIGGPQAPGTWVARVSVEAVDRSSPGREERGRALLEIREEITQNAGASRAHVEFRVLESDEIGGQLAGGLDGVRYTVDFDTEGRPVAGTVRFLDASPPAAASLLDGPSLAGFAGSRTWLPEEPVGVGASWPVVVRDIEANLRAIEARTGVDIPAPAIEGGARLRRVRETDAGRVADVVLDVVTVVEGPLAGGTLSVGHRARGEASFDVATGRPLAWEVQEHLEQIRTGGGADESINRTVTWKGEVAAAGDR